MGGRKEEKTGRRVTGLGKITASPFSIYAELLVNNSKYALEPPPPSSRNQYKFWAWRWLISGGGEAKKQTAESASHVR